MAVEAFRFVVCLLVFLLLQRFTRLNSQSEGSYHWLLFSMLNWCWLIPTGQIETMFDCSIATTSLVCQDPKIKKNTLVFLASGGCTGEAELLCLSSGSPVDLLCGPVPSCLPSPQLHPDPVLLQQRDLICFEEHLHIQSTGGIREEQPIHDRQPQAALMPTERCTGSNEEKEMTETSVSSVGEVPINSIEKNTEHQSGNTKCNDAPDSTVTKPLQPPDLKPLATESPSKRTFRNKIKLAANFSFSSTPSV